MLYYTFVNCDLKIIKFTPKRDYYETEISITDPQMEEIILVSMELNVTFQEEFEEIITITISTTPVYIQILKRNTKSSLINIHSVVWEFFYQY